MSPVAAPPVFLITGNVATGKTSLAVALLDNFDRGVHIDLDAVREMVISGRASPLAWDAETDRQFDLALRAAAAMAHVYHSGGFAVAVEGATNPVDMEGRIVEHIDRTHLVTVLLRTDVDVALDRNATRSTKDFDTSILEDVIRKIHQDLEDDPPPGNWHILDNSRISLRKTVDTVMGYMSS